MPKTLDQKKNDIKKNIEEFLNLLKQELNKEQLNTITAKLFEYTGLPEGSRGEFKRLVEQRFEEIAKATYPNAIPNFTDSESLDIWFVSVLNKKIDLIDSDEKLSTFVKALFNKQLKITEDFIEETVAVFKVFVNDNAKFNNDKKRENAKIAATKILLLTKLENEELFQALLFTLCHLEQNEWNQVIYLIETNLKTANNT